MFAKPLLFISLDRFVKNAGIWICLYTPHVLYSYVRLHLHIGLAAVVSVKVIKDKSVNIIFAGFARH